MKPSDPSGAPEPRTLPLRRIESPSAEAAFVVTVSRGRDQGASLVVDGSAPARLLVGNSDSCDLRLNDPAVSRRHLALDVLGTRLRLTDLGSSNGTTVDRISLTEAFLKGGELVEIGDTALTVTARGSAAAPVLSDAAGFGKVLGASVEMRRLYPLCERLARSSVPTIIEGETGTGKEVLAESLHEQGPRAQGPFVVFDCTAVAPNLVESELFGHEKGAFTGAVADRKGVFEQADGGTLFIDEIGDLDLSLQPKLLRALERSEVRPVGGNQSVRFDVRVIAATRRDLDRAVQEGSFRDDLFHRLAVGRIELPPLRERRGDVRLLAEHFCQALGAEPAQLEERVLSRWERDRWPGNVRELRNAVARQVSLGPLADTLPAPERMPGAGEDVLDALIAQELPFSQARARVISEFERRYVEHALAKHGGSVVRASRASGLARRYFQIVKARSKS